MSRAAARVAGLTDAIRSACERRRALSGADALRLLHDASDGVPGLVLERFGPVLLVQVHEERFRESLDDLRSALEAAWPTLAVRSAYLKPFPRDRASAFASLVEQLQSSQPWLGQPAQAEIAIEEHGLRFLVRPYDGYSCGLFLEQRDNRARVRAAAAGRWVLNLFAYTCGFGVAAAAGGGRSVNVDTSKRYLEWGKRNYAVNGLSLEREQALFLASDALDACRRLQRQGRRFGGLVIDAPTFGRGGGARPFALEQDFVGLLRDAVELLEPGAWMLASINHRATPARRLEEWVRQAASGRQVTRFESLPLPTDFAGDPGYAKFVWLELGGESGGRTM